MWKSICFALIFGLSIAPAVSLKSSEFKKAETSSLEIDDSGSTPLYDELKDLTSGNATLTIAIISAIGIIVFVGICGMYYKYCRTSTVGTTVMYQHVPKPEIMVVNLLDGSDYDPLQRVYKPLSEPV